MLAHDCVMRQIALTTDFSEKYRYCDVIEKMLDWWTLLGWQFGNHYDGHAIVLTLLLLDAISQLLAIRPLQFIAHLS